MVAAPITLLIPGRRTAADEDPELVAVRWVDMRAVWRGARAAASGRRSPSRADLLLSRRMQRPVTHVIFDMDGVLLDTERFYTEVTQTIVGRWGKVFDWSIKGNMIGRPARDSARYLVETLGAADHARRVPAGARGDARALFPESRPMPGARELTAALARAASRRRSRRARDGASSI
jgi:hypothetical protein